MYFQFEFAQLPERLLAWYRIHQRNLPWRKTYAPYHVWISEIMLQQTQMERGLEYFNRWIEWFPDIRSLADASEQEVLKAWEGLGYYSRARNLVKAAVLIVEQHGGLLPDEYDRLLALPGIGPYTAAKYTRQYPAILGNRCEWMTNTSETAWPKSYGNRNLGGQATCRGD